MKSTEISLNIPSSATTTEFAVSATHALGPVVTAPTNAPASGLVPCVFSCDVACWVMKGTAPVAVASTCLKLMANQMFRDEFLPGERISVIAGGAGTFSFTKNV
jgi:hypothetical protein